MQVSSYTYEELKQELQSLASKVIRNEVDKEIAMNNYKKGDKEWYVLERIKQRVVESAHLGQLK